MQIFKRKSTFKLRHLPTWDKIVETMRDKELNYIDGHTIVDVFYSIDNAHRFVILKSEDNYLTYSFESLQPYDEEELKYSNDNVFAYWSPGNKSTKSLFDDMELLMQELTVTPEYKTFFENR